MAWLGKTLASSVGSSFVESDNGPDSTLLCKELSWLLEDSLENSPYSSRACPFPRCEHWRDLVLSVQEGVLILRSETELIVDLVSDAVSNNEKLGQGLLTDVGTGSDAIAIGIVRNPPCIPSDNISGLQADDGIHEPRLGLDGGASGMDYLLHLYNIAAAMLKPGSFCNLNIVSDFAGIKRLVTGFLPICNIIANVPLPAIKKDARQVVSQFN
ncbi:hypothetical protein D5086_031346 [Populus alba]|uniref:Uncharacterized protein n=1 Tax=Populus alba TaxID=43335 RepID=A0ACC4AIE5_POPAL